MGESRSYAVGVYLAAEAISSALHWAGVDDESLYPPRHCNLSKYAVENKVKFLSVLITLKQIIEASDMDIGPTYSDGRLRLRRARKIVAVAVR